ncbi:MAG: nucleotidyltransferase substrate binding protein [Melioribacter sp.]|uniref:nucleotidyltransferase substrate binding protein n=1 Tax=Melioribacter sp. TaxID=2052167 RepID=UPI003BD31D40
MDKKEKKDIRWIQRFDNFQLALKQLKDGIDEYKKRTLSLLEKQGVIKAFEFTHELAWNVLKDFFEYQGNFNIKGSRDAVKEGFKYALINDGKLWLQMIETRNLTSHTYDKETAEGIISEIVNKYFIEFIEFEKTMIKLKFGSEDE